MSFATNMLAAEQGPAKWDAMTALTSKGVLLYGGITLGLFLVCVALVWMLVRVGKRERTARQNLLRDETGTSMMEFTMVLPILMFFMLAMTQSMFVMVGNYFVQYSAFAATRSAIVQIPYDETLGGDQGNRTLGSAGDERYDAVLRSAIMAVLPVAGDNGETGSSGLGAAIDADALVEGIENHYSQYGQEAPVWVEGKIRNKIAYASANTEITPLVARVVNEHTVVFEDVVDRWGQKDPVTIRVDHKLALQIPWANRIFADGDHGGGTRYMNVSAQTTLTNEGVLERFHEPRLPRIDQYGGSP